MTSLQPMPRMLATLRANTLRPRVETGLRSENSGRSDQDDARWRSSGNYSGCFPARLAKGRYGTKPWVCVRRR